MSEYGWTGDNFVKFRPKQFVPKDIDKLHDNYPFGDDIDGYELSYNLILVLMALDLV